MLCKNLRFRAYTDVESLFESMKRILFACAATVTLNITSFAQSFDLASQTVVVTAPFILTNNHLLQPHQTSVANGGRLSYRFTVPGTNTVSYAIEAKVNAPRREGNSFYVNIDAEPQDPAMVWDIPATTNFESRLVTWRGNGTPDKPEVAPKFFNLAPGPHELVIRGREAGTELQSVSFVPRPLPPTGLRIVGEGK